MKRLLSILAVVLLSLFSSQGQVASPGLVCEATDGERTVTFIVPTGNFALQADQSIHPQLKPAFKAQWSGCLSIDRAGEYSIFITDGKKVTGHQTIKAEAGLMPFRFSFERQPGAAQQQLWWQSEFFRQEPIPWDAYTHVDTPAEVAQSSKIAQGRQWVEDYNCIACHQAPDRPWHGRPAPDLSTAGSRLKAAWIFQWLQNPRHFQPSAVMPVLVLSTQDRADITAFLMTQKGEDIPAPAPVEGGKELFNRMGCIGCHGADGVTLAGLGSKMGAGALARYLQNPLAIDPSGRMPGQFLSANEAARFATYLAQSKNSDFEQTPPAGDAAHGKSLMLAGGCLNCHRLTSGNARLAGALVAPPWASLHPGRGCLADHPGPNVPHFDLTHAQRESLGQFIQSPDISVAPLQDVDRMETQFRCAVCHALREPAKLNFPPNQMPPSLVDAGNKLRRSALENAFAGKDLARPWLTARMPDYGAANIQEFLDGFAAQAGAELGEGARITSARVDMIADGMDLIGTDTGGLSCLTCHDFRGQPAGAETRAPDLTKSDERLRTDWVLRWLYQPSRIVHGTLMPDFFVGKPEWMANRDCNRLIQALSLGPKMPAPAGWRQDPHEFYLVVTNQPVVFRCFLADASPRSIAVGLPGHVSYCFDAAACQLRYLWTGGFLDARPPWSLRGAMPPKLLGPKGYVAPPDFPLRLDRRAAPDVNFLGYDLINGFPQFRYQVGGVEVRELITLDAVAKSLRCAFTLGKLDRDIWFNGGPEAIVSGMERSSDGWNRIAAGPSVHFVAQVPVKTD